MSTEIVEKEKKEISYNELFNVKVCHDMPDVSNDPTVLRWVKDATDFLSKAGLPTFVTKSH